MAFIQLAARRSMRDGPRALYAVGNRLYHMGLKPVARSTFAGANNSRPVGFFKDLPSEMHGLCAQKAPKHRFRFKSKLYSMDATARKAKLPYRVRMYDVRHLWITTALDKGFKPSVIAYMAGTSVEMIHKNYYEPHAVERARISELMPRLGAPEPAGGRKVIGMDERRRS